MKRTSAEDPLFGRGYLRSEGRRVHDMHLFPVKTPEVAMAPWDYDKLLATIPGDQAFRPLPDGGYALVFR